MDVLRSENTLPYLLKGAHPDLVVDCDGRKMALGDLRGSMSSADELLGEKLCAQGDVRSKRRAGVSKAIGITARKLAGWIERDDLARLSPHVRHKRREAAILARLHDLWPRHDASTPVSAPCVAIEEPVAVRMPHRATSASDGIGKEGIALWW